MTIEKKKNRCHVDHMNAVAEREEGRLVYARGSKVFAVSSSPPPYGQQLAFTPGEHHCISFKLLNIIIRMF